MLKNECFLPDRGSEMLTNISSIGYYLEGRKGLFLMLFIRHWATKMTLLIVSCQDVSVEEYEIYVFKFLFPQYTIVLKQLLNLKIRGV